MKSLRVFGLTLFALLALLALLPTMPARADFGTNWTATFYPTIDLTGTAVPVTGINGINFNWGSGAPVVNNTPVAGIGQDNFSVRFTSTQTLAPGTYNFVVSSDDGVRVYINNALRLDRWANRPLTTDTFTEVITNPQVNITVEYFENIDQAIIQVQWFLQGGQVGTPVPGFTPSPVATAVPPLTGQVQNVRGLSIRTGPYLGASFVGVAVPGTTYSPIARNTDEGGGFTWYLISAGDKTGWVSGRYLAVTGDPNSVPVQSTVFEQIDNAPAVGAFASPRSIMNLRRRPSVRSESLGQIPWGASLELIGRTVQGGENFWLQVRYNGQVGWLFAPYVAVSGNIDAVPIH